MTHFLPVECDELKILRMEINALTPPRPIQPDAVVVGQHGRIILRRRHLGLLLPKDTRLLCFESEAWGEEE